MHPYAILILPVVKLRTLVLVALAFLSITAGCSRSGTKPRSTAIASSYPPYEALIRSFWDAFNHYDLEKCMTVFEPVYSETKRAGVEADMKHFEQGRMLGVKLVVDSVSPLATLADGTLEARIVLKISPRGLSDDRYLIYNFVVLNGVWWISRQYDDPLKTPPGSKPENLKAESVSSGEVRLTWENKSTRATGVRLERASDRGFKNDYFIVDLPKDTTAFTDTGVKPGITYYYRLYAFNAAGASDPTSRLEVKVPPS